MVQSHLRYLLNLESDDIKIAVIGSYVGLPLSINFAKKFHVIGFDVSVRAISELKKF